MEFNELVSSFALLKLKVVTRLQQPLNIGGFAGDMLHNNWGLVLKAIDPQLADDIYDTNGQVKQFVIAPADALKKQYTKDEAFEFELTLFNQCCMYLPVILNALEVWQNKGFMPDKKQRQGAQFTLETITSEAPLMPPQRIFGFNQWSKLPQPFLLGDALDGVFQNLARTIDNEQTKLGAAITLHSPVRLTFQNSELRQSPTADIWFNAIARRLWLLAKMADLVIDDAANRDVFYTGLPIQSEVTLTNHNTEFTDFQRYSAKQRQSQNLGGLLGSFSYQAVDIRHLAMLEVGQYLKIGNKTTFGFGGYGWCLLVL
jgi:hypothetical protein